jgi:hypothetical protein
MRSMGPRSMSTHEPHARCSDINRNVLPCKLYPRGDSRKAARFAEASGAILVQGSTDKAKGMRMSVIGLRHVVAKQAVPSAPGVMGGDWPSGNQLLDTIGKYIPTDVTTAYIAAAAAMANVSGGVSSDVKKNVAIASAVLAAFAMWVIGYQSAKKKAEDNQQQVPSALDVLMSGWYEILVAGVALFTWATAMPDSWFDWGGNGIWLAPAVVAGASILFGGLAVLLNRT